MLNEYLPIAILLILSTILAVAAALRRDMPDLRVFVRMGRGLDRDLYARPAGVAGVAVERPAAPLAVPTRKACDDSAEAAIFISPLAGSLNRSSSTRRARAQPCLNISTWSGSSSGTSLT